MDPLPDPVGDRAVPTHPAPPAKPLSEDLLFPKGDGVPDIPVLRDHLLREGKLTKESTIKIVEKAIEIFSSESTLLKLKDPITVVGDIHGQYYDFVKLIEVGGEPPGNQYLFLGDYVDRGSYSVEVLMLIFAYKINFPKRLWMLRGNHECRQMTQFFNFRDECEHKHDTDVYNVFMEVFDSLPLTGLINGKFLGIHGGLSPELTALRQLDKLDRFREPPREGILCDLLWSDPHEEKEGEPKTDAYIKNEVRGCSWFFTYEACSTFLYKNSILSIIRAHEAQIEGYKMHRTNESTGFPTVITIFSAPNYCDVYNNKGAILKFDNNTLNILQFNSSPHPYHLPNFMDVFTWSMPFVVEKVTEMLYYILQPTTLDSHMADDTFEDFPEPIAKLARASLSKEQNEAVLLASRLAQATPANAYGKEATTEEMKALAWKEKSDRLRKKVRTVARLARMFKTLRQENETVIRLKGVCPGDKLPPGLLLSGRDAMSTELQKFDFSQSLDAVNEKRPDLVEEAK